MLLPGGQRVVARHSETCAYATLDPALKQELGLDREGFEDANCLLRGAVTHDGLPFSLPAPLQPLVFAIVLTHWRMDSSRFIVGRDRAFRRRTGCESGSS